MPTEEYPTRLEQEAQKLVAWLAEEQGEALDAPVLEYLAR